MRFRPLPLRRLIPAAALGALLLTSSIALAQNPTPNEGWEYVSPVPGSNLVSRYNNVILRPGQRLSPASLASFHVLVEGGSSGPHPGRLELSDDERTMVFQPDQPFDPSETVTVTVGTLPDAPKSKSASGAPTDPAGAAAWAGDGQGPRNLRFSFEVSPLGGPDPMLLEDSLFSTEMAGEGVPAESTPDATPQTTDGGGDQLLLNALPIGYPTTNLLASHHPDPGYYFLAPFSPLISDPGHLLVVDEYAKPIFYRRLLFPATDFKRALDGRIVFFTRGTYSDAFPQFYVLGEDASVVDSFSAGNGYVTDAHEIRLLPNGHVLLLANDPEPVRMDLVVPGGRPDATVIGLVVQELDRAKRVVFQWRSWDGFRITDAISPLVTLTGATVDYVHGNAIGVEPDGDLLLSSRHLSEITRISRRTGEIVWRMAPNGSHNDFTFLNDPRGFSAQHDVRLLPDGHMTLFNNGNYLMPQYSSGLEYAVDEEHRTVSLLWEFHRTPTVYGGFMGNVQRLSDGGTLIGWGGVVGTPKVTEIHPDQSVALEFGFASGSVWTYRAYRSDWRTTRLAVDRTSLSYAATVPGPPTDQMVTITNPGPDPVTLNYFVTAGASAYSVPVTRPIPLAVGESVQVPVRFAPLAAGDYSGKAYIGFVTARDVIVQDVALSGAATFHLAAASTAQAGARREPVVATDPAGGIHYALSRPGRVRVEMFDLRGRRVASLLDTEMSAGEHAIEWDSSAEPSGIYFCRIVTPDGSAVQRIVRLR